MVKLNRRVGRVAVTALVAAVLTAVPVMAQTLSVTADRVNLRAKPTTDSAIVATVERGAELAVIETAGSWYKVRDKVSGKEGYVHSLTVKVISGATSPASPAAPAAAPPAPPSRVTPRSAPPPPSSSSEEKSMSIVPMAGLIRGGGTTTWLIGAGVGFKPFSNPAIRVQADVLYHRFSESAPEGFANDLKMTANTFCDLGQRALLVLGGRDDRALRGRRPHARLRDNRVQRLALLQPPDGDPQQLHERRVPGAGRSRLPDGEHHPQG